MKLPSASREWVTVDVSATERQTAGQEMMWILEGQSTMGEYDGKKRLENTYLYRLKDLKCVRRKETLNKSH